MWKKLFEKIKNPSVKMLVVTYLVTPFCIAWTLIMLLIGRDNLVTAVLSYVSYAFAAITLTYTVYTIIATKAIFRIVRWVQSKLRRYHLTSKLMESYDFRTLVFSTFSLSLTVAYAIYNFVIAVMGIMRVWHGALAGYYIYLACMRGGIIFYRGKRRGGKIEREEVVEVRKFRNCGIFLVVVIISLSVAILQMVRADAGFDKPGMMIYIAAMYTCIKVTTSIMNFLKVRRKDDYTLQTLRNVNLADATVSVLALQTAMFHSFGTGEVDTGIFNAVTGAGVCLVIFTLGIYMIIKGNIGLKKLKKEEGYGEQK